MTHKDIVSQFLKMIMAGDILQAFDQFVGGWFVHHNQYTKPWKDELIAWMQWNHGVFPDKTFVVDMLVEEDDRVVTYSLLKFTPDHKGIRVVHIFRFEEDKIAEMRDVAMELREDAPNA